MQASTDPTFQAMSNAFDLDSSNDHAIGCALLRFQKSETGFSFFFWRGQEHWCRLDRQISRTSHLTDSLPRFDLSEVDLLGSECKLLDGRQMSRSAQVGIAHQNVRASAEGGSGPNYPLDGRLYLEEALVRHRKGLVSA
jgi:hypothetical protein